MRHDRLFTKLQEAWKKIQEDEHPLKGLKWDVIEPKLKKMREDITRKFQAIAIITTQSNRADDDDVPAIKFKKLLIPLDVFSPENREIIFSGADKHPEKIDNIIVKSFILKALEGIPTTTVSTYFDFDEYSDAPLMGLFIGYKYIPNEVTMVIHTNDTLVIILDA